MTDFKYLPMKELTDQQVRYAPPARRHEQVARADKLASEIDPERVYPYSFVCFRLTEYRTDAHASVRFSGTDLKHDLALFIMRVERSLPPLPIELAAEPMLTLEDVSQQFNVSTKTVSRWRMQGLMARRVIRNGKKQLGFPQSAVEAFAAAHSDQVARGGRFRHFSDQEKDAVLRMARQRAANGSNLTEVSKAIAGELGRSVEAIRYTIKNFDRAHPAHAVFPEATGPLDAASKEQILVAFQEGKPVDLIAKRFGRTRSSMYRVINEVRAKSLIQEPVDYIYNAEFDDSAMEDVILGPMPDEEAFFQKMHSMRPPKEVDAQMAYLYERPILSREQEAHAFRKMNFLKHQLHTFKQSIDVSRTRVQDLQKIEELQEKIKDARDLLIECNQRLVHSEATRHVNSGLPLDELKSDANLSVMKAVEKFDYSRGFKFSTYATWAIRKNFARSIPDENTRRSRYMTGTDEIFDSKADIRTDEGEILAAADAARARVNRLLEYLDPRTRDVIRMRGGLDGSQEMTLEQIGQHFGITKERVRQINVRGMKQLRDCAAQEGVELV